MLNILLIRACMNMHVLMATDASIVQDHALHGSIFNAEMYHTRNVQDLPFEHIRVDLTAPLVKLAPTNLL